MRVAAESRKSAADYAKYSMIIIPSMICVRSQQPTGKPDLWQGANPVVDGLIGALSWDAKGWRTAGRFPGAERVDH
jgi:hypothetical protein